MIKFSLQNRIMNSLETIEKQYPLQVDLSNCAKEPIHIINRIQPHGVLLTYLFESEKIIRCSDNSNRIISYSPVELIDQPISKILSKQTIDTVREKLSVDPTYFMDVTIGSVKATLIVHKRGEEVVAELEPSKATVNPFEYQTQLTSIVSKINSLESVSQMCDQTVHLLSEYLGFDRVMIYKFDDDWNGKVIAEIREENLEPWLGLQYPASDIPSQARQLFLKQGIRLIPNVSYESSQIISSDKVSDNPVDLSNSELRAVSSMHVEYLKNMKVSSTLTAAIVHNGALWGLIACHHYSPKYVNYYQRLACKLLTQVFSSQLGLTLSNTLLQQANRTSKVRSKLIEQMSRSWDVVKGMENFDVGPMELVECDGFCSLLEGKLTCFGETPSVDKINELVDWLLENACDDVYSTSNLGVEFPASTRYAKQCSGVLVIFLSREKRELLVWFRKEKIETINWAGNPREKVFIEKDGSLHPRRSFERWKETQKGRSLPWQNFEVQSVKSFGSEIKKLVIKQYDKISALNKEFDQAYKALESFSYSVSHDLRAPLRGIDGFAQLIKEEYYDRLDEMGKSAIQTIISSTQQMNTIIDDILAYSGLGKKEMRMGFFPMDKVIHEVLSLLTNTYHEVNIKDIPLLPEVYGDYTMIKLMMTNLLENAMKYSSKQHAPLVEIGVLSNTEGITFFVRDNGIGMEQKHLNKIFDVFNRVAGGEYPGSGVGLAIVKRIIEIHQGLIWVESKLGHGSTFYFRIGEVREIDRVVLY